MQADILKYHSDINRYPKIKFIVYINGLRNN